MILHLTASGVPTGWAVEAYYRRSYGIAVNSARSWQQKSDGPHLVIEIEDGAVKRHEFLWKPEYNAKQYPDKEIHLQAFEHEFPIDQATIDLVKKHVTGLLRDVGFLIPRDEWEQRYPASHLMEQRWSEFFAAERSARDEGRDLEWDPRWAMMMVPPNGWLSAYKLTADGRGVEPRDPAAIDPTRGYRWETEELADHAMRSMNSGWSFGQALVLQEEEPIDVEPAPTIAGP